MEPDLELKRQIQAAGIALGEAFSDWRYKAEKPEQDLNMQEVSDAWTYLMFREEQYRELTAPLREADKNWKPCQDCP